MSEFMSGLPTRIEGYRRRAEDARSKAENTRFGKTKASWLQLARLWDELADQLQPLAPTAETDAPHEDASTVSEREADGDENDKGAHESWHHRKSGFFVFNHARVRPLTYREPLRFETMPSRSILHA